MKSRVHTSPCVAARHIWAVKMGEKAWILVHGKNMGTIDASAYLYGLQTKRVARRIAMHRHIQTTNAIESLFSNVRQRTNQIDVFTTETSCLVIVWATIQDIRLHKISLQ